MTQSSRVSSNRVWSDSLSAAFPHPSLQAKTTTSAVIGFFAELPESLEVFVDPRQHFGPRLLTAEHGG